MVPNAAINRQYAKLSQMETFLMSNISPQKADLNRGVWQKLEFDILNRYPLAGTTTNKKYHVWVIVGPVFGANHQSITRETSANVAIPGSFFCILIRPKQYPYDSPGNAEYTSFLFGQTVPLSQPISLQFVKSINEIESLTKLNFLPNLSNLIESRIETAKATALW